MARDYKNSAAKAKAKQRPLGSWVSFASGLGIGLVCAVAVYFWRGEHFNRASVADRDSTREEETGASQTVNFEEQMDRALPKREFNFYKILPEVEVKVPDWEISKSTEQERQDFKHGTYVLQVGSFKSYEDADRAKARLALRGILAKIHRVVINGQDVWYRVHVGPFSDLAKIQSMRSKLIESDSDFILLKIGDSDD
jgi:cell division protein FtsN